MKWRVTSPSFAEDANSHRNIVVLLDMTKCTYNEPQAKNTYILAIFISQQYTFLREQKCKYILFKTWNVWKVGITFNSDVASFLSLIIRYDTFIYCFADSYVTTITPSGQYQLNWACLCHRFHSRQENLHSLSVLSTALTLLSTLPSISNLDATLGQMSLSIDVTAHFLGTAAQFVNGYP